MSCIIKYLICFELIFSPFLINAQTPCESAAEYSDHDIFGGYENNFIPDFNDPEQKQVFTLYLKQRFLGDTSTVTDANFKKIVNILEASPGIKKPAFPSISWQRVEKVYNVGKELKTFLQDLNKSSGKWRALYMQPVANVGDWLKTKQDDQNILESYSFLIIFPKQYVKVFVEKDPTKKIDLVEVLKDLVERIQKENIPENAKNFLIASAIHTFAYDDYLKAKLKLPNAMTVLAGLNELLQTRDSLANKIMNCSFDEILDKSNTHLKYPISSNKSLEESIRVLTQITEQSPSETVVLSKLVRPLSLAEASFRSCLAQDCASRTYFSKGLDPNFIYYTVQEEGGWKGHVTIALGEADFNSEKKKVAFVDKIQGFPLEYLPGLLEAIRQACLKMGYELSIPLKMGDINGIANEQVTRTTISKLPAFKNQTVVYKKFTPHSHEYEFDEYASRSDNGLDVKPLLPLVTDAPVKFVLHDPVEARSVDTLNNKSLFEIIAESFQLKFGDVDKQKKYFDVTETLLKANLPIDPEFKNFLNKCITDKEVPITLRYRAMTHLLMFRNKKLDEAFAHFTEAQVTNLIQNWMQKKTLALTAIVANTAWRSFIAGKISVEMILKYSTDLNPSDSLKLIMQDQKILEKTRIAVNSFMSTPMFQHKYVYTYIHQLALFIEIAKIALEKKQDDVVLESEQFIFDILDSMSKWVVTLNNKEKQEFFKLLSKLFIDPDSPFDEVVLAKYVKLHYENMASKTFWFRAKKTYIPSVLISSFWILSFASYKLFGVGAGTLLDATGVKESFAELLSILLHAGSFVVGTMAWPLLTSTTTNPHVDKRNKLKKFYKELSQRLKNAKCSIALQKPEEDRNAQ